jgi:hypothetical protein
MTDKYMVATICFNAIPKDLHLRPLSAIDQKGLILHLQNLRGVMSPMEGSAGGIA